MQSNNILGIDIGGTKTAVLYAKETGNSLDIIEKESFPTTNLDGTLDNIYSHIEHIMNKNDLSMHNTGAIGISCGGPLDTKAGVIMSPPNLPGWDNVHIVEIPDNRYHIPCAIQNDANACALAEWKFGAGQGTENMIFLTFGTGLGAGLILNGQLYSGTNDNAGEAGHIRLSEFGPVGYGKAGSFEGFASGGGIAQIAIMKLEEKYQMGKSVSWCPYKNIPKVTAQIVAENAQKGDELALEIINISAEFLGRGLSVLIDILNPECIIIGSIYSRNENLFLPLVERVLEKEALPISKKVCRISPARLGESIGDYAALSIASNLISSNNE